MNIQNYRIFSRYAELKSRNPQTTFNVVNNIVILSYGYGV
jgi:hypothetical protein